MDFAIFLQKALSNIDAARQRSSRTETKPQRNPFYPRIALIGTNETEALAVSLLL